MFSRRLAILALAAGATAAVLGAPPPGDASDYDDPEDLYAALSAQPSHKINIGGGQIIVVFADGAAGLMREPVLRWVKQAALAVAGYFGGLPTRQYGLLVIPIDSARVGHATTFGYRGAATRITVGTRADVAAFDADWVLAHEMVHTALPDLPRRALWLLEGNATWIEPVARAQAGQLPAAEVWRQALRGMPQGLRSASDGGFDGTREWSRLYWGGAIFWLQAEIAIYERSGGRFLLRDALRAINRASGGNSADWSPEQMMAEGDRAVQSSALSELYRAFAERGVVGELPSMFARLGVSLDPGSGVRIDPRAELADLTRRITRR